jgi:hypothetical protein
MLSKSGAAELIELPGPVLNNAHRTKGTGFTALERDALCIRGLLPSTVRTLDEQVSIAIGSLNRIRDELAQYEFLLNLLSTNARVFFATLARHTEQIMPIIYTPVVGHACLDYGALSLPPAGMFISWSDAACNGGPGIYSILANWHTQVRHICVVLAFCISFESLTPLSCPTVGCARNRCDRWWTNPGPRRPRCVDNSIFEQSF